MSILVRPGDCLDVMRGMADNSVHAVVTDPPYNLAFMSREWDTHATPRDFQDWCTEWAAECLRVLRPGGYLLAFGGTRTFHRLACAVEDAGFEIRDSIAWLYGSGFPKSLDVGKAIDKAAPRVGMYASFATHYAEQRKAAGLTHEQVCEAGQFYAAVNHGGASANWERGYNVPTRAQWVVLAPLLGLSLEWLPLIERVEAERDVIGSGTAGLGGGSNGAAHGGGFGKVYDVTAPATSAAREWAGWGTALKPAFEPVVVARKPLTGSVAGNVQEWGCGALNITACRVNPGAAVSGGGGWAAHKVDETEGWDRPYVNGVDKTEGHSAGRWPANVVLDGSQADALDQQSGITRDGVAGGMRGFQTEYVGGEGKDRGLPKMGYGGEGGASRFFPTFRYQAKAPTAERPTYTTPDGRKVAHPTVKPLGLMRWLVKLVTPPGGTVLDPFAGSGATLEACLIEGFDCVAIERDPESLPLIQVRIDRQAGTLPFGEAAG
jgi:DNA modification methylase